MREEKNGLNEISMAELYEDSVIQVPDDLRHADIVGPRPQGLHRRSGVLANVYADHVLFRHADFHFHTGHVYHPQHLHGG